MAIDRAAVNKMVMLKATKKTKPRAVSAAEMVAISEITDFPQPLSEPARVPLGQEFSPNKPGAVDMTLGTVTGARGIPEDASPEIDVTAGLGAGGLTIVSDGVVHGDGMTFSAEVVRDWWRLPPWMLARFNARPGHIICFPVRGGSMLPTISDNDVVFIDTRHRVPSPPGLYALTDEFGGLIVKRLEVTSKRSDEDITVRVKSDNPEHITREVQLEEVVIIGIVVGKFTMPEA
ncbi:MAG: S24 family peptidase [bacterium]|nr:S24 family peptidase [bacterium]